MGNVLLALLLAGLPDRSQNVVRTHEALVKLHAEQPGLLVKFRPDDPRNGLDFGAHGVGTTCSDKAAPFFHALNLEGDVGRKVFFGHAIASLISPGFTTQCPAGP